jgi:hypothetical protein
MGFFLFYMYDVMDVFDVKVKPNEEDFQTSIINTI